MFDLKQSGWDVPGDLAGLFRGTWDDLARPGSGWTGEERLAIAETARAARTGERTAAVDKLPPAAVDAVTLTTTAPSAATEDWVGETVDVLGEVRYIELVAVASVVFGIDTIMVLLGLTPEPLPPPVAGQPTPPGRLPGLKRRSAWVSMTGPPLPRHALSAVPSSQLMANRLLDRLYMTTDELRESATVRGLSRVQLETVIVAVSHSNECFY